MQAKPFRIGVSGFGVAGATAAFLLAKTGHRVTLFERAPVVGPVGAGVLLQPSGQRVLRELGLLDDVVRNAERIEKLHAIKQRGRTLIELRYADLSPEFVGYGVHRGDLFEVLRNQVNAAGVEVRLGHEKVERRTEGDDVFLVDAARCSHGPFDFVLAADGGKSRLRRQAPIRKLEHEYAHGAVWGVGRHPTLKGSLQQVVRGSKTIIGLLPTGGDRCSLFCSLRRDRKEQVWRDGFVKWRDEVLGLAPLAEPLFADLRDFDQLTFTTYQHVWMASWHDKHCLFLGDAAHAMSPHLGQGVNLALLDAVCFVRCLATADGFRAAFAMHQHKRAAHVRYFSLLSLALTPFFQSNGLIKGWGRDLALPILSRIPLFRRQMLKSLAGIKTGFFWGTLDKM